jgi:diaminohydroxyphosphoribosylaminopyrimidine deaminase/5-amino-6-(5-phosphoribosylamino)uracil reductase
VELRTLAEEGVQSLLLEGGPTLAAAFIELDLIDKLLVFVAPRLSGSGPPVIRKFAGPRELFHVSVRPIGEDVLFEAYLHEP